MRFLSVEEIFKEASDDIFRNLKSMLGSASTAIAGDLFFHGTTDLAILFNRGVVMATDGRATESNLHIGHENFDKMFSLDSHSLIAISGVPGIGFAMAKLIKARLMFEAMDNEGTSLPAETKASMIAKSIGENLGLVLAYKMIVHPIMATVDLTERMPCGKIFDFWIDGITNRCSRHVSCGSGSQTAETVLDLSLDILKKEPEQLALEEAKHLAVLALKYAHKKDAATGEIFFMRVITEGGIEVVSEEEIKEYSDKITRGEVVP